MYIKKTSKYLVGAILIYTGLLLSCPNPNGSEKPNPEGNISLKSYLVSYKANGASGDGPSDQKKIKGQPLKLADNSEGFIKTGKVLKDWNSKADGTGIEYKLGESYTIDSDLTLYAIWYIPIKVATDFDQMRANLDESFVLQNDIDLSGSGSFQSIGTKDEPFTGIFDGQNHKINNLNLVQANAQALGFFSHLKDANIHDLQFANPQIEGMGSKVDVTKTNPDVMGVAVLAGYVQGGGSIERVTISQQAKVKATEGFAGGLVGRIEGDAKNKVVLTDCKVDGTLVEGKLNIGGLVGYAKNIQMQGCEGAIEVKGSGEGIGGLIGRLKDGSIIDSHNTKSVSGNKYVGGLVGHHIGDIENSYVTGTVTGTTSTVNGNTKASESIGGLVGFQVSGTIIGCYVTSEISGDSNIAGLAGVQKEGIMKNSYSTGKVTGTDKNVGGLIGYQEQQGSVVTCHSTGEVSASQYVGGLLGRQLGSIRKSYSSSKVVATLDTAGGLVGFQNNDSSIIQSYATGEVSGTVSIGGLVGYQGTNTISQSYATGKVIGTDRFIGGLVGKQNSNAKVSKSYSTGEVSGGANVGGFVGRKYGQMTDDYFASDSSKTTQGTGSGDSSGITAYTTADLTGLDKFNDWDFGSVWRWLGNNKWPELKWQQDAGVNP